MGNAARFALIAGAAVLLAGCGSSRPPIAAPGAIPQAQTPASFLYMAQCCYPLFSNRGNIVVYDSALTGVSRTISKGVSNPWSITVDRAGRLYMMSLFGYQGVVEYDAHSDRPSRRIKLSGALTATTDSENNLYAAACPSCIPYGSGRGSVNVYRAGTTTLLRSITDDIYSPTSLALDTHDNLYVVNNTRSNTMVLVYPPGSSKPSRKLSQGFSLLSAIALDSSNDLYVLRSPNSASPSILEYRAASKKILRTITNGLSSPQAMTLDSSGTLYVANTPFPSNGWVSVYPPGATTPSYEITSQMNDPQLLAVDAAGNLYVGNDYYAVALVRPQTTSRSYGSVCVYEPHSTSAARCVANQQDSYPYSLAVKGQ